MKSNEAATKRQIRFPALPDVTAAIRQAEHPPFDRHIHLHYHIGVVLKGAQRFWHKGSQHYLANHSLATINPDEVHDGYSVSDAGYHHGVLQFSEDTLTELFNNSSSRFFKQSLLVERVHVNRVTRLFQSLSKHNPDPEQVALQTEEIKLFLGDIFTPNSDPFCSSNTVCSPNTEKTALHAIRYFIKDHVLGQPQHALPLAELAQRFECSQYQIIRGFKKYYGITPYAYQLCLRLERAKACLVKGATVVDVAHEHGFSDQSHFTRCFGRAFFLTPAQFQKQLQ